MWQQIRQGQTRPTAHAEIHLAAAAFPIPEQRCHAQGPDPARESQADGTAAEDATVLAGDAGAQQLVRLPALPQVGSDQGLSFCDAARQRQQQGQGQVRGGIRQNIRSIHDGDAPRPAACHRQVIHTHG